MSSLSGNNHGGQQSHGAAGLASQLLGGLTHSGGGSSGGQSSSGIGGKLASQLASNLFHSSDKPPPPQNYHGGQSAQSSNSGGLAGSMMGGVAHMFGGKPQSSSVCSHFPPSPRCPGVFLPPEEYDYANRLPSRTLATLTPVRAEDTAALRLPRATKHPPLALTNPHRRRSSTLRVRPTIPHHRANRRTTPPTANTSSSSSNSSRASMRLTGSRHHLRSLDLRVPSPTTRASRHPPGTSHIARRTRRRPASSRILPPTNPPTSRITDSPAKYHPRRLANPATARHSANTKRSRLRTDSPSTEGKGHTIRHTRTCLHPRRRAIILHTLPSRRMGSIRASRMEARTRSIR